MRVIVAFIVAGLLLGLASVARAKQVFEDTKWTVTVTPEEGSKEKEFKDTLTFKGSKLSSVALAKKGFTPADYDENARPGGIGTFSAEQTSPSDGKAKWSGQVAATEMSGEMTWTKPDGSTVRYTVKGEKAPER